MTDLDKKLQKHQPDLVQAVMDAFCKGSVERVDVLINNAFKQLKMSRFKLDQTTCISLLYLARICPRAFAQSTNLVETLKSHVKRDSGPTNIKGSKNDFILPVLAANILLATCDSPDVRIVILTRIEQWISSNQKLNDLVQHLLAVLCVKSIDTDTQTIRTLIDMRHHWFQFIDANFDNYGPVSPSLASSIRNLLNNETNCESLIENLSFLTKYDPDLVALSTALSKLINLKPVTVKSMLNDPSSGNALFQSFMSIYEKLFQHLQLPVKKSEDGGKQNIYFKFSSSSQVIIIQQFTVEAILSLLASQEVLQQSVVFEFIDCWLKDMKGPASCVAFFDAALTESYKIPSGVLQHMIGSPTDLISGLALVCATSTQLMNLVTQFGLPIPTIKMILTRLAQIDMDETIGLDMKDSTYFNQLMQYFSDLGIEEVKLFTDKLDGNGETLERDCKHVERKQIIIKKEVE